MTPASICGCSSVVEHLLAKERVESSNLFIRFLSFVGLYRSSYWLFGPLCSKFFIMLFRYGQKAAPGDSLFVLADQVSYPTGTAFHRGTDGSRSNTMPPAFSTGAIPVWSVVVPLTSLSANWLWRQACWRVLRRWNRIALSIPPPRRGGSAIPWLISSLLRLSSAGGRNTGALHCGR